MSSSAAQLAQPFNEDFLLVARVVLFMSQGLPLYPVVFVAGFQRYIDTIHTFFLICTSEYPLRSLPPLPAHLGLCTMKQIMDLIILSSELAAQEIAYLANVERGRLWSRYSDDLAEEINVLFLQGVEWYQHHWKTGPCAWEIFAYRTSNHITFLGSFPFALHAASTSLVRRIQNRTNPQASPTTIVIPLDYDNPHWGFYNPAQFTAFEQNFTLNINRPFGYYEVRAGKLAVKSKLRIRCMHCGFMASVAWRNQVDGKHDGCQNGFCQEGRRYVEVLKMGMNEEVKGEEVDVADAEEETDEEREEEEIVEEEKVEDGKVEDEKEESGDWQQWINFD